MPTRRLFVFMFLATSVATVVDTHAQGKSEGAGGRGNGGGGNGGGSGDKGGSGNGNAPAPQGQAGGPARGAIDYRRAPVSLRLRHRNGFEERIYAGRYEMRDNRGRPIVNRPALNSDYARLRRGIGR